ncbi:hypothetical protein AAG570_003146, partial [Ranatra chinensis]
DLDIKFFCRFAEPSGFAPRRLSSIESPRRNLLLTSSFTSPESGHSSSTELSDDGFMELSQGDKMVRPEDDTPLPTGLGTLLSGAILCDRSEENRTPVQRCNYRPRRSLSESVYGNTMPGQRFPGNLPQSEEAYSLKRPLQRPQSPPSTKRHKPLVDINNQLQRQLFSTNNNNNNVIVKTKGTLFQYGFTKTKPSLAMISSPPKRTTDLVLIFRNFFPTATQEELIGDFSRPFALPLMSGKHEDLKSISCETLGSLINGEFDDHIASYRIIDCRYPYEYEGGHIKGAVNLYTQEQVRRELVDNRANFQGQNENQDKRHILIFHCEFSSERGPRLSRFLRKEDRNDNIYPRLHYPELYLLNGGYSAFFKTHGHLCEPRFYKPMHDPAHATEFKHFRAKSKTWSNGSNKRSMNKGLSRLGF